MGEHQRQRLTDRGYWEQLFDADQRAATSLQPASRSRLKSWLRSLTPPSAIAFHVFWDVLLPRYIQKPPGATVVEIGCAPGRNLLEFYRRFGYSPFGIEYTSSGVETTRELFSLHHFNPDAIIHADLFDEDRLRDYRGRFDIVFSGGLIEHFEEPRLAVQRHVDLLAPSGILLVSIPNLQGLNWLLCKLSCPSLLAIHNLSIMNTTKWSTIFDGMGLTQLYSGYYGVVDLGLLGTHPSKLGYPFIRAMHIANVLLAASLRHVPDFLLLETSLVSPYLVYIGRKD